MKKIIENINEISDEDVFAIPHAVSDGTWVYGFYRHLAFEAKVKDEASAIGINKGRIVALHVTRRLYTDDNSYIGEDARFSDGVWSVRPRATEAKETIAMLIEQLEKLPFHKEFETEKQTA